MNRREALLAVAGAASIGLAGCTDDSASGNGTDDEPADDEPADDEPTDTETDGENGSTADGTDAETTDTGTTDDGSTDGSTGTDGDPDGEIRGTEGLGLEILEYDHVIREREEDSRSDYDEAYDVQGRLELIADAYVNVQVAYEFLDDAGERLSYYETTKLMQQGDVWEFSGAYSKSPEDVAGYVLHVSCQSDCSA